MEYFEDYGRIMRGFMNNPSSPAKYGMYLQTRRRKKKHRRTLK